MWLNGMGGSHKHRRFRRIMLVLLSFTFMFVCSLFHQSDAWKLRDLTSQKDPAKSSKTMYKELPMRKIARIVKDTESQSDDNSNIDTKDVHDDVTTNDKKDHYEFEKVHSSHFDLPLKPVAKLSQPDLEMEDEEIQEETKSVDQITSFVDILLKYTADILPIFDPSSLWEWLRSLRNLEDEIQPKEGVEENATDSEENSWWSYLNRKPFKSFYEYLVNNVKSIREAVDQDGLQTSETGEKKAEQPREPMTYEHFENRLLTVPSFVPNYTNLENIDCKRMGQIFQRQIRGQKLWAMQMADASGKISAGLLRGNANQLGDFDSCMEIRTKVKLKENYTVKIKGKYCLANVDVLAKDDDLKLPVHLLQGRNMLRSHLDDVGLPTN